MQLVKDRIKRDAHWIPYDWKVKKQVRTVKGVQYGYVEFAGTKEENATAKRLGRPLPQHRAWVQLANLEGHGGV